MIAGAIAVGCGGSGAEQGSGGAGGKAGRPGLAGSGGTPGGAGGSAVAGSGEHAAGAGGHTAGTGGAVAGAGGDAAGSGGAVAGGGGAVAAAAGAAGSAGAGEAGAGGCRRAAGGAGGNADSGGAASVVLYSNDFEAPNVPLAVNCGNALDNREFNFLYGTPTVNFSQTFTVEGLVIHDPDGRYADPAGTGKRYAVGIQTKDQDDHLGLTLAVTGQQFLNVGFDLSSIDVAGCGGPFGVAVPKLQVSLYDTPTGTFNLAFPGKLLAQETITGVASPSPWTFAWKYSVVMLDATGVTGSAVTVVFDLVESGYAAIDNLSIVASRASGVVDRNNNGIPDDQETCGGH